MEKLMGVKLFVVLAFVLWLASFASGAGFPKKQIEILFPYGVTSGSAAIGRLVAENMSKHLGKQVIITPAIEREAQSLEKKLLIERNRTDILSFRLIRGRMPSHSIQKRI